MLVSNKNQILCPNEGFGILTYKSKIKGIIGHFPALAMEKETTFVFQHVYNIYLPTHIILSSLSSITR
jgi:hypothetical protein